MTTRTKWLAAALLVAAAMTTTIGTVVFSDATGQQPGGPGGFPGGGGPNRSGARSGAMGSASGMAAMLTPKWEYKIVHLALNEGDPEKELNKLGEDGWELSATSEKNGTAVFKRPKARTFSGGAMGGGFGGSGFNPTGGPAPQEGESGTTTSGDPNAANKPVTAKDPGAHVLPLKHAKATELQETLASLVNADYRETGGGGPASAFGGFSGYRGNRVYVGTKAKIAADSRTNSLIVITNDETLKTIKELIEKLDIPEKADKTEKTNAKP